MAGASHGNLPLFAYGTLMFPAVVQSVIGRVPDCRPASIEGYRRLEVAGESFPGLVKEQGDRVEGVLYFDICDDEWERLTAFEDGFYELEEVFVRSSRATMRALAYIVPSAHKSVLSERVWDPELFRKNHLRHFSRPDSPGADQEAV